MIKEASRQVPSLIFEGMTSISAVLKGEKRKVLQVYYDTSKERECRNER